MAATAKSRYTLIKGNFWIRYADQPRQGPQPDGDTITFHADKVTLVRNLPRLSGRGPNINARGNIPVRYEAIDALETHFEGTHQQIGFADAARDENLRMLGFRDVKFFADMPNNVESAKSDSMPGFVIANGIEANGRFLGLVYPGSIEQADGTHIFVEPNLLDRSVNAKLVAAGLAYMEPYDTMPISLVKHLREVIGKARANKAGLFAAEDVSLTKAATIRNLAKLQELAMWPKLFRRLAAYFSEGHVGLGQFDGWMREDPVHRDDSLRLPDGEKGNMHDAYIIDGDAMKLRFNPEDLLIAPDPKPMLT
jgi:hypothetical protein